MAEQANFSELRSKISNWDIEAEQMLLNKMQIFTNSYNSDFANFTKNMQNLDNNLSNAQVEQYKAVSCLKELSMNRFIEETLEEKSESVSEGSDMGLEGNPSNEVFMDNNEKMKTALDITMKHLEEINAKKEKNKEQIEDDTVSVASKNMSMDNLKKYANLPFIIGTEDFMNDNNIGLSNPKNKEEDKKEGENNEEKSDDSEDPDVEEFISDIKVDEKDKKRWEQIKKKKKNKKKKKKGDKQDEEEGKEDFGFEIVEQVNIPKEKEEIKVEAENKDDDKEDNFGITSGKGATVPPPPPPPPVPVFNQPNVNSKPNKGNENIIKDNKKEINIQNENININNNNTNSNNITNPIPTKPINIQPPMNHFLMAGLKAFGDDDDDDEDDEDDGGFFGKNKIKIPVMNNKFNNAPVLNPIMSQQNNFNKNENININNNSQVNNNNNTSDIIKAQLNNIFGEENIIKQEKIVKEEDIKVKEEKNNNNDDFDEPIKINQEMDAVAAEEEQKVKKELQEKKDNEELKDSEVEKIGVPELKKEKFFSINQSKMLLNSLFSNSEEEKNNSEEIKPVENQHIQNNIQAKKKLRSFFEDDD